MQSNSLYVDDDDDDGGHEGDDDGNDNNDDDQVANIWALWAHTINLSSGHCISANEFELRNYIIIEVTRFVVVASWHLQFCFTNQVRIKGDVFCQPAIEDSSLISMNKSTQRNAGSRRPNFVNCMRRLASNDLMYRELNDDKCVITNIERPLTSLTSIDGASLFPHTEPNQTKLS